MARLPKGTTVLSTSEITSASNGATIVMDRRGWPVSDKQEIIITHELSRDGNLWVPWGRCATVGGEAINDRLEIVSPETFYTFFLPRTRVSYLSRLIITVPDRPLTTDVGLVEKVLSRSLAPPTNSVGFEDSDSASFDSVASVDLTGLTVTSGNCVVGLTNINWNAAYTVTGVNWDQAGTPQALTQIINHNGQSFFASEIWRRLAPTTGNLTMRFSFSNTCGGAAAAISLTSVDQTTPTGTPVGANGSSTAPSASSIGSETDGLVLAVANGDENNLAETGTNHIEREFLAVGSDSHSFTTKPGAASVQVDWTMSSGRWVVVAVGFKEAAAAGGPSAGLRTMTLTGAGI